MERSSMGNSTPTHVVHQKLASYPEKAIPKRNLTLSEKVDTVNFSLLQYSKMP